MQQGLFFSLRCAAIFVCFFSEAGNISLCLSELFLYHDRLRAVLLHAVADQLELLAAPFADLGMINLRLGTELGKLVVDLGVVLDELDVQLVLSEMRSAARPFTLPWFWGRLAAILLVNE